jgi:glycosyltransferase involved in cell wall biosynthesis
MPISSADRFERPQQLQAREPQTSPLRVCVDARLISGASGGVESVVIGMAHALSNLDDGDEEFVFLAWPDENDWIQPYVSGSCRILFTSGRSPRSSLKTWLRHNVGVAKTIRDALAPYVARYVDRVSPSDGTIERAGVDLMHFPIQLGFRTEIPSIYHPHDLQHLHLPEYFSRRDQLYRELVYRTLCDQAAMVAVGSSWIRRDVIGQFGLAEGKVHVVPLAPVLTAYPDPTRDDLHRARTAYGLPEHFALYPAQTWAHKNHIGLLNALALLRDARDMKVELVCTGALNDFFPRVQAHVRDLRLEDQVRFVGFVSPLDLQALYRLARAVVIPSKFEASSLPLWDAFLAGVPAACSTVTSLPEQAGDAALLFDPNSPEQIADAIQRLWIDDTLRQALARRGKANVSQFTWDRTARHFRAHYRRITRRKLTDEDVKILSAPPLL